MDVDVEARRVRHYAAGQGGVDIQAGVGLAAEHRGLQRRHQSARDARSASEAEMLKSLSPIHKLDRIKTPLIVLHGANDTNVPLIEAEQIVADFKRREVPVEYVLFPDKGHGWQKLPNRVRSTTSIVYFFDRHLNTRL